MTIWVWAWDRLGARGGSRPSQWLSDSESVPAWGPWAPGAGRVSDYLIPSPYQGLRPAPVAGGLTCQLQVASVPRQGTSAAAGRALGAHRRQRRWQVLGNTIYHDICSKNSYYIIQNVLTCACYVPPLLYKPSKGCNITGYFSKFYQHNQKKWDDWSQQRVWPCYIGKKICYIAPFMLYNTLCNLIICYIWHPKNGFVFLRGIYNVLCRFFLLYNMLCNKKCAT